MEIHAPQYGIGSVQPDARPDFVPQKKQPKHTQPIRPRPNIELLNAAFDTRMYARMGKARRREDWEELCNILLKAYLNDNLRYGVSADFIARCPHAMMVQIFKTKTNCKPNQRFARS